MDTVPQIISTKDLSYISDMFELNYTAYKQINYYLNNITEEGIIEILEDAKQMHYNHLVYLISILNGDIYKDDMEDTDEEE